MLRDPGKSAFAIDGPYGRPWFTTVKEFASGKGWHVWLEDSGSIWDVAPDGRAIEGMRQDEVIRTRGIFYTLVPTQTQAILLQMASRACAPHLARMGLPSDLVGLRGDGIVGRTLVAKRSYASGEIILDEAAFVSVPDQGPEAHLSLTREVRRNPCMVKFLLSVFGGPCMGHVDDDPLVNVVGVLNLKTRHPRGVTGLFPTLNFVNHSCAHNCDLDSPSRERLRLVARVPIDAGDPLTISYVTVFVEDTGETLDLEEVWSRDVRRAVLKEEYGFECSCDSCKESKE